MPHKTVQERIIREAAMKAATDETIEVPLSLMKNVNSVWNALAEMATIGNINCRSDIQVCWP